MATALRYFASARARGDTNRVLPMSEEDRQFWRLYHSRKEAARDDG